MTEPALSAYVYPWDVAALGAEFVLNELAGLGISAVNLAATYHTITTLSPRYAQRGICSWPEGGVFVRPDQQEFEHLIRPNVVSDECADAWDDLAAMAPAIGIELEAWTVGLYQPWLVRRHPDVALCSPLGWRSNVYACPSAEPVQEYLAELCRQIVTRYEVVALNMESISHPPFAYGWVRPRLLTPVPACAAELLQLCFCSWCKARANDMGVAVGELRAGVRDMIARSLSEGCRDHGVSTSRTSCDVAAVGAIAPYRAAMRQGATALVARLSEALRGTGADCRLVVANPVEPNGGATPSLDDVVNLVDGLFLWRPSVNGDAIRTNLELLRGRGLSRHLFAFHPPGFEMAADGESARSELAAVKNLHVDEIGLYHYGLRSADEFARLVTSARTDRSS